MHLGRRMAGNVYNFTDHSQIILMELPWRHIPCISFKSYRPVSHPVNWLFTYDVCSAKNRHWNWIGTRDTNNNQASRMMWVKSKIINMFFFFQRKYNKADGRNPTLCFRKAKTTWCIWVFEREKERERESESDSESESACESERERERKR